MTCTGRLQTPPLRKSIALKKNSRQYWTANPTSQNWTVKENSQNPILQQRSPPFFLKPYSIIRPHQSLISFFQLNRRCFSSKIFPPMNTEDTLPYFKKNLGSLNPMVNFYKCFKNMHYLYQTYIIYNTNFIIHTHLYYF